MRKFIQFSLLLTFALLLCRGVVSQTVITVDHNPAQQKLVETATKFFKAASVQDWKTLYALSVRKPDNELPIARSRIEKWTGANAFILDNPEVRRIFVNEAEASFEIVFQATHEVIIGKKAIIPRSYEFDFQKINGEWKVSFFDSSAYLFINYYFSATNNEEEKKVIEDARPILEDWEGFEVIDYGEQAWRNDSTNKSKFRGLYGAVINNTKHQAIAANAYYYLGNVFIVDGNYEDAAGAFEKGLKLGDSARFDYANFLNLTGLSEAYVFEKKYLEAEKLFRSANAIYFNDASLYSNSIWASSRIGNALFNNQQYLKAAEIYEDGLRTAKIFKDVFWQVTLLKDIGDSYFQLKNYATAQVWYEMDKTLLALPVNRDKYRTNRLEIYQVLGNTYQERNQRGVAFNAYKEALSIVKTSANAREIRGVYEGLANFHTNGDDLDNAVKTYTELSDKLMGLKAGADLAEVLRDASGHIAYDLGRIKEADNFLKERMQKAMTVFKGNDLAELLITKGGLEYLQGNSEASKTTFQSIVNLSDVSIENRGFAWFFIGMTYAGENQFEKSAAAFEQMDKWMVQSKDKDLVRMTTLLKLFFSLASTKDDPGAMIRITKRIVESNDDKTIVGTAYLAQAAIIIIESEEKERDKNSEKIAVDKAITLIDKSLDYLSEEDQTTRMIAFMAIIFKTITYYEAGDVSNALKCIELAETRAKSVDGHLLVAMTKLKAGIFIEQENWLEARNLLAATITELELNSGVVTGGLVGMILKSSSDQVYYQLMVRSLLALNESNEALKYAEKTKAKILLEFNSNRKAEAENRVLKKLNQQLPFENTAVIPNQKIRPSWKKYEDFTPGIEFITLGAVQDTNNEYKNSPKVPECNFEEVKLLIPNRETALLEFFVDDGNIYLFVLADESVGLNANAEWRENLRWRVYTIEQRLIVEINTNELQKKVSNRLMNYSGLSRVVYDALLKPAERQLKGKKNLIIIPDGFLWAVPFQALQSEPEHFLIEDYTISYAPSLTLLTEMKKMKAKRRQTFRPLNGKDILAIGISSPTAQTFNREPEISKRHYGYREEKVFNTKAEKSNERSASITLPSLPRAVDEAKEISNIYGPSRVQLRVQPADTKMQFLNEASRYRILHIATHGILNPEDPMNVALVFGESVKNSGNIKPTTKQASEKSDQMPSILKSDRLLRTKEIMEMNLNADLIILSACDTASGEAAAGEGLIGLSWAFAAAGVPTIVSSQWTVSDEATAFVMKDFHQQIINAEKNKDPNFNIADALRNSALKLIKKNTAYNHPYFWASFVTIGDTQIN